MKKTNFLKKIKKQDKLSIVEPSEEIKTSYLEKSESNLISTKILLENNRLEESVSLCYYSMYHMLIALLFKFGIKSENHTVSIILLKDLFSLDNKDLLFAKEERIDKQYYTNFKVTKEEVLDLIEIAESFNKMLFDFISKVSNQNIDNCRKNLRKLLK